ncbi:pyridoxamine 5'-phosphate oxidase family protein [Streptococcus porcinus]|uniref:Pyridoxamine 5'-phosphate oxidase protein n=2 Tax=Streptococcus porcinus TaxID=1340 RepID=A0A4V0H030_STRPO|nr:pyridoxamine 5'-phosphate oxidase family protein [Streptococcus porcinus]EGJ27346.1 pyridoxamine 5'-phosphate oxidase family protein [Streptococcus porcinus str. Jelinkova 176]SQG42363.1 pyridoxamine 5'-phosphate oxidase protein [Streptococcus porcinus]VTT41455.1 pyridoxamine 5'-phosphate oxidase protein [Streptococcus porcinus]VTT42200.1 pyridoxamine 5'-phosphate oxidase protein [Streptococcus porcinus]
MEIKDMMALVEDMKVGVFATVGQDGEPHARHAHITAANEEGIFFMTSPKTRFYQQLMGDERIALTAMLEDGYLTQVIRIEGVARPVENKYLKSVFANNPYYDYIYKDDDGSSMQVFHLYKGEGFYHSLTQGHKYIFSVGRQEEVYVKPI